MHESDAPVTRPDLDALIARADRQITKWQDRRTERGPATIEVMRNLRDALAAERARVDQALQRIADAPHDNGCGARRMTRDYVNLGQPCTCCKSDAPTAEQGS